MEDQTQLLTLEEFETWEQAEIYSEVEKFKEIKESIVVGQTWDNDIRIILFVVLNLKI